MSQIRSKNGWIELPVWVFSDHENEPTEKELSYRLMALDEIVAVCKTTKKDAYEHDIPFNHSCFVDIGNGLVLYIDLPYEVLRDFIMENHNIKFSDRLMEKEFQNEKA